jgi:hypothetical protein
MGFPVPKRRLPTHAMGGDFAGGITDALVREIGIALHGLSTADKNRVMLSLVSFLTTQLEALETNNEPEEK